LPLRIKNEFIAREIRVWRLLKHHRILELQEFFEDDEKLFFVSLLAERGTLYTHLKHNGPAIEDVVQTWMWQIITGVQYMHLRWIAHRDLKLENILLFEDGTVKVADFGFILDHIKSETETSRTYCGSRPYMAPEILLQLPYLPFKADVWAIGIMSYALLTARYPFDHHMNVVQLTNCQRLRDYKYPDHIIPTIACRDAIDQLLTYDAYLRPTIHEVYLCTINMFRSKASEKNYRMTSPNAIYSAHIIDRNVFQ
uniref:Aurora kinase n=1 Tax=Anisakis simplex TaxID=6269 RepID=A0A0M3JSF3_ANISI